MGCGLSRMEAEEDPKASLPPVRRCVGHGPRRNRVRERKDSTVSTTDLLRSSADDISDVASSAASSPRSSAPLPMEMEKRDVVVVDEMEGRRLGFRKGGEEKVVPMIAVEETEEEMEDGDEAEEGEKLLPGSPSFRFYFQHPVIDKEAIDEPKIEKESVDTDDNFVSLDASEVAGVKSQNKVKRKRLRLKSGPNAVYNLFTAQGCYHQNNQQSHHSSLARVAPSDK